VPFFGVGGSDIIGVVLGDHSVVLLLEFLLSGNSSSGSISSFLPGLSGLIRGGRLSVHGIEFGISDSLERGSSSVHHVDFRGRIVPFFGVSLGNIISIVFGDHSVMLLHEFFLGRNFISRSISSLLPSSSRLIRGLIF
jgi:hypothetical protein